MGYSDIDTAKRQPRESGDLAGRIEASLLRKAVTRAPNVTDDQRELRVIAQAMAGTYPVTWAALVMDRLESGGKLAAPTDGDIDTAMTAVWNRLIVVA